MRVYENVVQGSDEWHELRRGRPTATGIKNIFTPKTMKVSASRDDYMDELAEERMFDVEPKWTGNEWTERGHEMEPEARQAFLQFLQEQGYEAGRIDLIEVGFILADNGAGCSPDSILVEDGKQTGGVEIKCPAPRTHSRWTRECAGGLCCVPAEHKIQCHASMVITGLPCWHFFSYCPPFNPLWRCVLPDDFTKMIAQALDSFLDDYRKLRESLGC